MKKLAVIILCVLCNFVYVQAQKKVITLPGGTGITPQKIVPLAPLPTTNSADRVEIYEQPNFAGRVAKYAAVVAPFNYPFPNKRDISLKVAGGYVALIKFDDEFQSVLSLTGDQPNFGTVFTSNILSITVKPAVTKTLFFSGISLEIHNNDCKKIQGTVKVKLVEKQADGSFITCPVVNENGTPVSNYKYEVLMFSKRSLEGREANGIRNFVYGFDGRTVSTISSMVSSNKPLIGATFMVSEYALTTGNVFVEVVPDLTVAHKSNDLADDYSDKVKMLGVNFDRVSYSNQATYFSTKAFLAKGNPNDSHGRATGVDYSIIKHIRIHFGKAQY